MCDFLSFCIIIIITTIIIIMTTILIMTIVTWPFYQRKKRLSKAGGFVLRENAFSSSNAYMIFIQIVAYVL